MGDQTTTYESVSEQNEKQYINLKDDESIINAIHPSKPVRHHKAWQKWEDEKLLNYIKGSSNTKDSASIAAFAKEFQRRETSITNRITKIKTTQKEKSEKKAQRLK